MSEEEEFKAFGKKQFESIEDLPISSMTLAKLRKSGYESVEIISQCMPRELEEATGVSNDIAKKLIEACKGSLDLSFEKGSDVLLRRQAIEKISTGSEEFDALLGGGVETQAVTECYGRYSSGKTQVGFQLCVNVQLPKSEGGLEGEVVFIDTESTFRPERIKQMADARGMDGGEVLSKIHVARAMNSNHQMLLLNKAEELLRQGKVKLVVVDSLTAAFRSDYLGRETLNARQQMLNKHIHMLLKFAERYNSAVYVTNQVMDNPGILFGDPTTPIGGNVVAHTTSYRLYLRRSKEDRRIAKLVDSPNLPDGECVFRVTEKGLEDA